MYLLGPHPLARCFTSSPFPRSRLKGRQRGSETEKERGSERGREGERGRENGCLCVFGSTQENWCWRLNPRSVLLESSLPECILGVGMFYDCPLCMDMTVLSSTEPSQALSHRSVSVTEAHVPAIPAKSDPLDPLGGGGETLHFLSSGLGTPAAVSLREHGSRSKGWSMG